MITITSVNNGDKLSISIDKELLKTLPEVINHPTFSNELNWGKVSVVLKHTDSSKRLIASFSGDFSQPDLVTPKMTKKGQTFELHKIVISSASRSSILSIKKTNIPNSTNITTTLEKDTFFGPSIYPRIVVSTGSDIVSGAFKLYITTTVEINGLSSDDISVSNGTIQQLYTTENPLSYEADIVPNLPGQVTVFIPSGVVTSSTDVPNVASNSLVLDYVGNSPSVSTDGYRYYMFSARSGWSANLPVAKLGIRSVKLCWDDVPQKLEDSSITFLKTPVVSDISIADDTISGFVNYFTTWNLTPGVYNNLFKVDLGQKRDVTSILIRPEIDNYPKDFKLYASNDNQTWTQILSVYESSLDDAQVWINAMMLYHREFIIKSKQNEFTLKNSTDWSSSLSWSPSVSPNSSQHTAILSSGTKFTENGVLLDKDITLNKLIVKPIMSHWTVNSATGKTLTMDGDNPKIMFIGESPATSYQIQNAVNINQNSEIIVKTDGFSVINGKITSNNKELKITQECSFYDQSISLLNQNNDITGKLILDTTRANIKNASSSNCTLEWSNKKAVRASAYSPEKFLTILNNLNWSGPIVFKNDGDKTYSIQNSVLTPYTGVFSGSITNGLHLKNCALNQTSNNIPYNSNNIIYIPEGTVEWNHVNAMPNAKIRLGANDFNPSTSPIIFKYPPETTQSTGRQLIYSGYSSTFFNWLGRHVTLQLNNSEVGNITFIKNNEEVDPTNKIISIIGSGRIDQFSGDGSDTKIYVESPGHELSLGVVCMLEANKSPKLRAQGGGKIKITGRYNSSAEVYAGGKIAVTGEIGPVTSISGSDPTEISGNGTINGNLTITADCSLYPTNRENSGELEYAVNNRQMYGWYLPYGMKVDGNFISTPGSKILFNFASNMMYIDFFAQMGGPPPEDVQTGEATRLIVYGDVTLGATIESDMFVLQDGHTAILMTYTGNRTGTFVNNLGQGISIVYDDANKRILAVKS